MDLSNVRIKEHFGLVTNDTSTNQFSFLVSPPKNRESIEKEDVVCLDHPKYGDACQVLAEVKEVTSYEEVAGSTIGERIGKLQATAQVIGYFDLRTENRPLQKLLLPPHPGSRIYVPYAKFLEDVFNRDIKGKPYKQPIYLGKADIIAASTETAEEKIHFYLDAANLPSQNTLISAIDGAGKTHVAKVIVEEIANKTHHTTIVIDPHNEYTSTIGDAKSSPNPLSNVQTSTLNIDNSENSKDNILKKIKQNQVTIITAENMSLAEKNENYDGLLNAVANSRREKAFPQLLLVIDDADNISPQAIQEVLSQKTGLGTILLVSHPTLLGGKVLSQIQNHIIGKTFDPQGLAYFQNAAPGSTSLLPYLTVGEWVVNGLNLARSTKIHVRD